MNLHRSITEPYPKLYHPFVEFFNHSKYKYVFMVEPSYDNYNKTNYKNDIKFDFFYLIILFLRKIFSKKNSDNFSLDRTFGKIISLFMFKSVKYDMIITLQFSGATYLRGIFPDATIIDYQHGLHYPIRDGGFIDKKGYLRKHLKDNKILLFLWGKSLYKLYDELSVERKISKSIFVFGYDRQNIKSPQYDFKSKYILITLSYFTTLNLEIPHKKDKNSFSTLQQQLIALSKDFPNIKVLIKHHPKSEVIHEVEKELEKIPNVKFYDRSNNIKPIFMHFSFMSSSIFEFALKGVPTQIISNSPGSESYLDLFNYSENKKLLLVDYIDLYKTDKREWESLAIKNKEWAAGFFDNIDYSILEKHI